MKKYVITGVICLLFLVAFGVMTGLNAEKDDVKSPKKGMERENTSNNKKVTNTPTKETKEEKTVLTMWCIATMDDSTRYAYECAIEEMTAEYPNVEFRWDAMSYDGYKTKIKVATNSHELPDIFYVWEGPYMDDFAKNDILYCLDDAYEMHKQELPEKFMKYSTYNGHKYGIPTTKSTVNLFANKNLLEEVGYSEIPKTYKEMVECCQALMEKGITPFGMPGTVYSTWCVSEYLEAILIKELGPKALDEIYYGNASWDNINVVYAVNELRNFIKRGFIDPNMMEMDVSQVISGFQQGQYAFIIGGSWNAYDLYASFRNNEVLVGEFPVINPDVADLGTINGGAVDVLSVYSGSEHAALAAEYAFELAKRIAKYEYLYGNGIPVWEVDYSDNMVNYVAKQLQEYLWNCREMVLYGDYIMNEDALVAFQKNISYIIWQDMDGQAFIEAMKNATQ